jgi:hypothetical protein
LRHEARFHGVFNRHSIRIAPQQRLCSLYQNPLELGIAIGNLTDQLSINPY